LSQCGIFLRRTRTPRRLYYIYIRFCSSCADVRVLIPIHALFGRQKVMFCGRVVYNFHRNSSHPHYAPPSPLPCTKRLTHVSGVYDMCILCAEYSVLLLWNAVNVRGSIGIHYIVRERCMWRSERTKKKDRELYGCCYGSRKVPFLR